MNIKEKVVFVNTKLKKKYEKIGESKTRTKKLKLKISLESTKNYNHSKNFQYLEEYNAILLRDQNI